MYAKGPQRQVFRWDQIESIQGWTADREGRTIFTYKVRRRDGSEIKLNNQILNGAQLIGIVLEKFSRQAAAQDLRMVPSRSRIFSAFKLDCQGISDEQGAISWQEIEELTIDKGTMAVLKRKAATTGEDHAGGATHVNQQ